MTRDDLQKILIPTRAQLLVCLGIAALILGVFYREVWWARLFDNELVPRPFLEEGLGLQLARLSTLPFVGTLVIALFWGSIGLAAYLLYLAAHNAVTEARNEVVIETEYTNKGKLQDRLKQPLLQLSLAVWLAAVLVLSATAGLPLWLWLFERFLFNPVTPSTLGYLAAALSGLVANLYAIWALGQIVFDID
ncbi:hypothetical protein KY386_02910 [Candidatus Parcubacteria bacterium]|nr:hypothetical protein [Candidatus Parcubacteria bacterium]